MFVALTVVASLVVLLVALPVWALVDASAREQKERWIWIVAVIVLWPVAGLVYGLFRARSRALRAVSIATALANVGLVWIGHENAVVDAGGGSPTLELYEAVRETETLELVQAFGSYGSPGNDDYVQDVGLSRDGARLMVSGGRSLRLWDAEEGRAVQTFEELPANDVLAGWLHGKWLGRGDTVALSADGTAVAAERGSVTIRLGFTLLGLARDLAAGGHAVDLWIDDEQLELSGHSSNISHASFIEKRLVTSSFDGTLKVWDLESVREEIVLAPGKGWIDASAVSPDGRLALVSAHDPYGGGGARAYLGLWDLASRTERFELAGHDEWARTVAFTDDGSRALTASFDGFRVWSVETGDEIRFVPGNNAVFDVVFSPDGRYALAGSRVVYLWDLETGTITDTIPLEASDDRAGASAFAPDGSFIVIGTARGALLRFGWTPEG